MLFRAFIIFVFGAILCSCGLQPLLRDDSAQQTDIKSYKLNFIVSKRGYTSFNLKNKLEQKKALIEAHLKSDTVLHVGITEEFTAVNVVDPRISNRNNGRIAVDLKIVFNDPKTNKPVEKTTRLDCISSYDLSEGEQFAAEQTRDSVRNRLIDNLSNEIIRETLYLIES